ncbi:MAG: beta-Ala-His dipeptidase [Candidatus Thorarchaeota archaeon]
MENLALLGNPPEFWDYLYQISRIPRCTRNETQIREFIRKEAERFKFLVEIDQVGNIVVKIPSKAQNSEKQLKIVLQCHMDMVCNKIEGVQHDFSKDPLKLKLIDEDHEKWLTAEGTTLGADNGVGIAYQLSIMKKVYNGELNFAPLELDLVFTVDEEGKGMGILQLDTSLICSDYLINLDAEDENEIIIGSAGLIHNIIELKIKRKSLEGNETELIPIKISLGDLIGGHSGVDINKGRANAIKLLSQILWKLNKKFKIYINSLNGGTHHNSIPRESQVVIYAEKSSFSKINTFIQDIFSYIKDLFNGIEKTIRISVQKLLDYSDYTSFQENFQNKLLSYLYLIPDGLISMHPKIKDLVQTSSNLGTLKTEESRIIFQTLQRSSSEYEKYVLNEKIFDLLNMMDLKFSILFDLDYPSWSPNFNLNFLNLAREIYQKLFNIEAKINATHGTCECNSFTKYFPNMEMISIGPTIKDGHSPNERLKISSVEKIWRFLIAILNNIKRTEKR